MIVRLLKVLGFMICAPIIAVLFFPFLIVFGESKTEHLLLEKFYWLTDFSDNE